MHVIDECIGLMAQWDAKSKDDGIASAAKKNKDDKVIRGVLEKAGATEVEGNGYSYSLNIGNTHVSFVNQVSRLCITQHRILNHENEKQVLNRLTFIRMDDERLYKEACDYLKYDHVIIKDWSKRKLLSYLMKIKVTPKQHQGLDLK